MARLDSTALSRFLGELDKELTRDITLIAVGGTALTLLDAKPSTIDVDFALPNDDYDEFQRVLKQVPHGFTVHCFHDGMIFTQDLPEDYLENASTVRTKMKHIELKALDPIDIVVTKIGRLNDSDMEDIESCIKKFGLTRGQVEDRAAKVVYIGREENYRINLKHVLEKFF